MRQRRECARSLRVDEGFKGRCTCSSFALGISLPSSQISGQKISRGRTMNDAIDEMTTYGPQRVNVLSASPTRGSAQYLANDTRQDGHVANVEQAREVEVDCRIVHKEAAHRCDDRRLHRSRLAPSLGVKAGPNAADAAQARSAACDAMRGAGAALLPAGPDL